MVALPVAAMERLRFDVSAGDETLRDNLRAASLVARAFDEGRKAPEDVLAAALSDYGNIVGALYASGYYGGVVSIRLDGRETAEIALLNTPSRIEQVTITISPGDRFTFGSIDISPAPPGVSTDAPARGDIARSGRVQEAVRATVYGWQEIGHATAKPVEERIVADHPKSELNVAVRIDPGPLVRFGTLILTTPSAVRENRMRRIAGLPSGEVFSPATLQTVATRLRRTGAFSSVSLSEAETLGPGDTLDVGLAVTDAKPRRFGFGAEVSSFEGLELSAFWLHRNLLGGAERLRIEGEVSNIGGDAGGINYSAGIRYEVPAALGTDTTAFALARIERLDEPSFTSNAATLGIGARKIFSDTFEAELGLNVEYSDTRDDLGEREFTLLTFPAKAIWDFRDNALNTRQGAYLAAELMPFVGLDDTESGVRGFVDARTYRSLGAGDGIVLAARLQWGAVLGPALTEVRPDDLFFSGGGGSVRGQPFQSLDVDLGGGINVGGRSFLGLSGEVRIPITDKIGGVAFADAGYIGAESLLDGSGEWHSGAGVGLRYQTGLGPIRLDVAAPVSGDTGDGIQLYLGIGQAF